MPTGEELALKHEAGHDPECPICVHKQRNLLEKYYTQRRPKPELARVFVVPEKLLDIHARAVKIYKKRANNTASIVDIVLEKGQIALEDGSMELTVKDLAWAVGHRDKLLGRIRDKVDISHSKVVHIHTMIPGAGGIEDSDVKEIKSKQLAEELPSMPKLTLPGRVVESAESENERK